MVLHWKPPIQQSEQIDHTRFGLYPKSQNLEIGEKSAKQFGQERTEIGWIFASEIGHG